MCSEDDRTKKKKDDKSDKNNEHCDMITAFYCAFIVLESALTAIIAANVKTIGDNSLVLAFIGILATFVVISNYAQMLEVRHSTKDDVEKMNKRIEDINKNLQLMDRIYRDITSSYIVELNKIHQTVQNPTDENEAVSELNKLLAYTDYDSVEVKLKIIEILNNIHGSCLKYERVAEKWWELADALTPYNNKESNILGDVNLSGYELAQHALINKRPDIVLYGFYIIKKIARITKDYKAAEDELKSLSNNNDGDDLITPFINTLIKDLRNINMDNPIFDQNIQKWIVKCKNNK